MCGICGANSELLGCNVKTTVAQMACALFHRGPDDGGQYDDKNFSMAMRRLSIIDLSGGHQPIESEDGNLIIVFNGEIYNYLQIRQDLMARGHRFKTNSDTEVLLRLYEEVNEDVTLHLRGMFAFCIYDRRDGSVFLARDRFGEKPLFYSLGQQQGFVFSSEINSLLQHPLIERRLDREALAYYLRAGIVPAPLTMFKDIRILPAGHSLKWKSGEPLVRPYYSIEYCPDARYDRSADAVNAVTEQLRMSVNRQKISDVPVGVLLSGGIDSSAVAAMLSASSANPIKTFTVSFQQTDYDEGRVARAVAQHLGTEHHEIPVAEAAFQAEDLWRIVDHVGVPFFDSSAIPTYLLSKQVGQEVKVALSGDGGDELFAGYDMFRWGLYIRKMQRLPQSLINSGLFAASWACQRQSAARLSSLRKIRRSLEATAAAPHMLPIMLHHIFSPLEMTQLVVDETLCDDACGDLSRLTDLPQSARNWTPLRKLMYFRMKHVLHDRMLTKVDRMSMAASLEIRTPMLDVELADLSMRLPDHHLLDGRTGKSVLRKAIRQLVPKIVLEQPKRGFDIPLHTFQNSAYRQLISDLLLNPSIEMTRLFHKDALQKIVSSGLGQVDNRADKSVFRTSHQLWALLQLFAWQERFNVSL